MGNNPMWKSLLTGAVLQALMVLVGKVAPSVGQIPNFYAICGTALSVVAGALFSRWSPGVQVGQAAGGGAVAGGGSSIIGSLLAVATGQWPGFDIAGLGMAAGSGAVGGLLGGLLGRMLPGPAKQA